MINQFIIDNLFILILQTLSVHGVTQALVYRYGPGDLFFIMRAKMGALDKDQFGRPKTFLGKLFTCPYCLGAWVATALSFGSLALASPVPTTATLVQCLIVFLYWTLAAYAGHIVLERAVNPIK